MDLSVDQVLSERSGRATRAAEVASLALAALLHAAVVAAVVFVSRLAPHPPPLDYVAVQVIPAQALGVPNPPSEPRQAPRRALPEPPPPPPKEARPETAAPPPPSRQARQAPVLPQQVPDKPEKRQAKPKPEPPDNRTDPTTRTKVLPPPREVLARRLGAEADTKPEPRNQPPADEVPVRRGGPRGTATGKVAVGSSIATLDNPDFTYDYYLAQLVSRIDQSWTRPPVGSGVRAVVSFHIQRDGSITDLDVRETSGIEVFDLSALRAVQNAAPFPPLPRAYTHDSLGVSLIVR